MAECGDSSGCRIDATDLSRNDDATFSSKPRRFFLLLSCLMEVSSVKTCRRPPETDWIACSEFWTSVLTLEKLQRRTLICSCALLLGLLVYSPCRSCTFLER